MTPRRELAPAKVNLCLFLGPRRTDGRHELVTVFESVGLFDELTIEPAARDSVHCPGVPGPNLVQSALAELRAAGWAPPPLRVSIEKRIPVAAGMGGGSADAAALLRIAAGLSPLDGGSLTRIAAGLGADVPSQIAPGASLGTGAGERLEPVEVAPHGILLLPSPKRLSTAEVYREADRLGLKRPVAELQALGAQLREALAAGPPPEGLLVNDLEPASLSLCPSIGLALTAAARAGADQALVCGSGPTVIGLFWGADGEARAQAAAQRVRSSLPGAVGVGPVGAGERSGVAK